MCELKTIFFNEALRCLNAYELAIKTNNSSNIETYGCIMFELYNIMNQAGIRNQFSEYCEVQACK